MKFTALFFSLISMTVAATEHSSKSIVQHYQQQAQHKNLEQDITWKRLMYLNDRGESDVSYSGYFQSENGKTQQKQELMANIEGLFAQASPDQSVRCRFPARSNWLIRLLSIPADKLPDVACPEFDRWIGQIKPHKATLIYATDFMGNPSSMFGHTLLRLDPKDQKQLNLVSYAVNYAATVNGNDNWSYAWKGLTGQYPGEYSLMPYYRKVKEYGDFESRDLWEYELNLTPEETRMLVEHIWEMQKVSFPYYFVSDNCAYRLLGLIDLVRPELNLKDQFSVAAIPVETLKSIAQQDLVTETVYRPALETQLLSQAAQHGKRLAREAHAVAYAEPGKMSSHLEKYTSSEQAKILEMAYDDLYLKFTSRQVDESFAQPRFRQLLGLRSRIDIEKQRSSPEPPKTNPVQSHHARNFSVQAGEVQGDKFVQLGHRQAYHDLRDPQGGFRTGTQLMFWDGSVQYRDDRLKLNHFDFLSVNSYNPVTPFKTPLSWGFNLGWQQEAVHKGVFSENEQHGVFSFKAQMGSTLATQSRKHLCYAQIQNYAQAGKALDNGWRVGMGPTAGCQNIWTDKVNSLIQVELPYWEDSHQWNLRLNSAVQYSLNQQNSISLNWEYQQQNDLDWMKYGIGFYHYF